MSVETNNLLGVSSTRIQLPLPSQKAAILEEPVSDPSSNVTKGSAKRLQAETIKTKKRRQSSRTVLRKRDSTSKERYGRWTAQEHKRLMEALDKFGNTWARVAEYVGTRSADQIRSHVQKHFLKVKKLKISEMVQKDELKNKIFVVTREYRNNTRALMLEMYAPRKRPITSEFPTTANAESPAIQAEYEAAASEPFHLEELEESKSDQQGLPIEYSIESSWEFPKEVEEQMREDIHEVNELEDNVIPEVKIEPLNLNVPEGLSEMEYHPKIDFLQLEDEADIADNLLI